MKLMIIVLSALIILMLSGVLFLRKYYFAWCKSVRNKRKSGELLEKIEFLIRFIAVMLLLMVFVATMIFDCLKMGK